MKTNLNQKQIDKLIVYVSYNNNEKGIEGGFIDDYCGFPVYWKCYKDSESLFDATKKVKGKMEVHANKYHMIVINYSETCINMFLQKIK